MPRDNISVATSTSVAPLLNLNITWSRSSCERSECISSLFIFIRTKARLISFTFCFLPEKIITRLRLPALKMSSSTLSFCGS